MSFLSLVASCDMLPDERLFDEPTDIPTAIPDTLSVTGEIDGHDYVDLGLPSGIKWATHNVGATKPWEYGGYYAWGETEEKDNYYDWVTYKWCNGSGKTLTKYCNDSYYGTIDNNTVLDPEDDVAHVKWGGSWRMPTEAEQDELRENCTWTWTIQNSVIGYKVTSESNGNSIFLPAAGYRSGPGLYDSGSRGYYWSSSLDEYKCVDACYLNFYSGNYGWGNSGRWYGRSVRPVCGEPAAPVEKCTVTVNSAGNGSVAIKDKDGISAEFEAGSTVTVVATPDEGYLFDGWFVEGNEEPVSTDAEYTFTVSEDIALVARFEQVQQEISGYEAVDLGLSVKWAAHNVGATKPWEYGGYYAWGETEEKKNYEWNTYKWCNGRYDTMIKYCTSSSYGTVDNKTTLDPEDDVAHVKWGGDWRMPTKAEQDELRNNCTWTWTIQNGVNGYKVTSKTNGNSIFLPAAGSRCGTSLNGSGSGGDYWSSSLSESSSEDAYHLYSDSGGYDWYYGNRYDGRCVRPVSK